MTHCRICGNQKDLKYSKTQFQMLKKQKKKSKEPNISGNICYGCEDRLQNFHLDDPESEVDVDKPSSFTNVPLRANDDKLNCENLNSSLFAKNEDQVKKNSKTTKESSLENNDVTEIIEVLTSRENTPEFNITESTNVIKTNSVFKGDDQESDDEIIFTNCEPIDNNTKIQKRIKSAYRKRKGTNTAVQDIVTIDLNSDEESDNQTELTEKLPKSFSHSTQKALNKNETSKVITLQGENKLSDINFMKSNEIQQCSSYNSFPTATSTSEILKEQKKIGKLKCPKCRRKFLDLKEMIHHMRSKHRYIIGGILSERPRCPLDSAMTIRLRYKHRSTFYECQLCGTIDISFKDHKQHVIEQHPAESISLNDPLIPAALMCPICEVKIDSKYELLCFHLLNSHKSAEYEKFIKRKAPTRCRKKILPDQNSYYRVFQFIDCKHSKKLYVECYLCKRIIEGFLKFDQHLKKDHSHLQSLVENESKKSKDSEQSITIKNKNILEKDISKMRIKSNKQIKTCSANFSTSSSTTVSVNSPKHPQRDSHKRRKSVATQTYNCKFCQNTFKGFILLNLHIINKHREILQKDFQLHPQIVLDETTSSSKPKEIGYCKKTTKTMRKKRKNVPPAFLENGNIYQSHQQNNNNIKYFNHNQSCSEENYTFVNELDNNNRWLQDLLNINTGQTHSNISKEKSNIVS